MKKPLYLIVGAIVTIAWLSLIPGYVIAEGDTRLWAIWVTSVALITEGGIWLVALSLGVAVFEARRRLWRWITRRPAA